MKKILFISNHAGFSKFNAPYMQWFHEQGWQVDNVSPGIETGYYDNQYDLPISRSPYSFSNLIALKQLKKICKTNQYDLIHCHTPVGGVLGRLCLGKQLKKTTKIIYTAHGFHFFKGASKMAWILFYPIEKLLSKKTDCIVTINDEDFDIASRKFHATIKKIDGVGVNLNRFKPITQQEKKIIRENNGFQEQDFIIVYCAQFIPRKNHKFLIDKIKKLRETIPNIKLCLFGSGEIEDTIKKYTETNGLDGIVKFLGYRKDAEKIYAMSDLLVSTSLQEGFAINLVEGMACGLPIVVSNIRGHRDIVGYANNNILFNFEDDSFEKAILKFYNNQQLMYKVGEENIKKSEHFSVQNSLKSMEIIYREVMGTL